MNTTYPLGSSWNVAPAVSAVARALKGTWEFLNMLRPSQARAQLLELAADKQADQPELAAQLRKAAAADWL
jgi:hypothetical protein